MKRVVLFWLTAAMAIAALNLVGCSSGKDTKPLEPGDPESPTYQMFSAQFEGVDEIAGDMFERTFILMDSIMSGEGAPARAPMPAATTAVWDEATQSWIFTIVELNQEEELTFTVVDTIKFWHGTTAVQYPKGDSLTRVTSRLWMTAEGTGDNGGSGHIFVTIERQGDLHEVLVVDGSGAIEGHFSYTDIVETDTTSCSGSVNFTLSANNLTLDLNNMWENEELNCPISGSLGYTGSVNIACTGANAGSVVGTWTVNETFHDGTVTFVFSNGTNTWTASHPCGTGGFESGADSAFVVRYFDGPDNFMMAYRSVDVSVMLLDSIPAPGAPKPVRLPSAAQDGEYIVISAIHSYEYSNGWHIFDFSALVVDTVWNDTVFIGGIDSVQVYSSGELVQYPGDMQGIDQLRERVHAGFEGSQNPNWGRVHHSSIVNLNAVGPDTTLSLTGTVRDTLFVSESGDYGGWCEVGVAMHQTVSNLTIPMNGIGECPLDGEMVITVDFDVHCEEFETGTFDYSGNWTVNAMVNPDQTVTLTFTGGDFHWTTIVDCGGGAMAPRWSGR
ncbi:MAG: hypothetical protein AB1772_06975 [Candidatus Zixiibacteriota bacterium]